MNITCKKCGSKDYVKSGTVRGKQRYKCKSCGLHFVEGDQRVKVSSAGKALAMLLYGSGKASYGFIARLFGVSRPAVLKWVRKFAAELPEPEIPADIERVQIDEMWHFINKKNKKYGSGEPWTVIQTGLSDGILGIVLLKPLKNSTSK